VVDHFYPTLHEKYINIHCDKKIDSRYYEYFPQVLNLIKPYLNKYGYAVYQVGEAQDPVLNADGIFLNLNYKQSAYLIKNSKLHVGIDDLLMHIASIYDIPIIALYSNVCPAHSMPYWSSEGNVIILESDKNSNKPSYSPTESPKTIRTIKPESIAQSILDLLKINEQINFTTLKIGSHYHVPITEIVPNFKAKLENQKEIFIRADLNFDDQLIAFWCANYKSKIITNQIIPLELVNQYSANIEMIFFKLKDVDIPNEYFDRLRKLKVNFIISCFNLEKLAEVRNAYFDYIVEHDNEKFRVENQTKFDCKFLTNKVLISKGKLYPSEAHLKLDKELDLANEVIYSDNAFWKDAEHFYFYEQN
jgi:hypothetical protein